MLGEHLAQVGAKALVLGGGPAGQFCVELGRQISDQHIHAATISLR